MGVQKFSTEDLPASDRLSIWRDLFGRTLMKAEIDLLDETSFLTEASLTLASYLTIRSSCASAALVRRTPELVADGDDNFVFAILRQGPLMARQGNREVYLGPGDAYLWSNAVAGESRNPATRNLVTISLNRASLEGAVKDVDAKATRLIPSSTEVLRLLSGYVDLLLRRSGPIEPALLASSAAHIGDLIVLALGALRDPAENARRRGLRAARLMSVKADILANLTSPDLTVESIARRHGVSARTIGDLFAGDQTTFGDFVREQRLRRAYRMLLDGAMNHRAVSEIALSCGFGDISHFNHCFRRRFGETPTDVRAQSKPASPKGTGEHP
jgi:AraC-like DNA-binding protein